MFGDTYFNDSQDESKWTVWYSERSNELMILPQQYWPKRQLHPEFRERYQPAMISKSEWVKIGRFA